MSKRSSKRPPRALGYARVTTGKQALDGHSMATQDANIKRTFEELKRDKGVVETRILIDPAVSAGKRKLKDREGGAELLRLAEPGDFVVANDITRLFRRFRDGVDTVETWNDMGVHLILVRDKIDTTTWQGKMFIRFMMLFGQIERDMASERTKEVLRERKRTGKATGGRPPFGMSYAGQDGHRRLVPCERELLQMQRIARMKDDQGMSFEAIYNQFLAENVRTKDDKAWNLNRVWLAYKAAKSQQKKESV
jgi:DNA invertase Pin-like site-specific DNA recombinase